MLLVVYIYTVSDGKNKRDFKIVASNDNKLYSIDNKFIRTIAGVGEFVLESIDKN